MLSTQAFIPPITHLVESQGPDTRLENRVFFFLLHWVFIAAHRVSQLWRVGAPLQLQCVRTPHRRGCSCLRALALCTRPSAVEPLALRFSL